MIDQEKLAEVRTRLRGGDTPKDPLSSLTPSELRRLRSEIDRLLPDSGEGVNSLNLDNELVEQYRKTKDLMDEVLSDEDTPANQKAQVCNSVVATLAQLAKLQEDLKREQSMKIMEAVLIDAIKTLPEAVKSEFFTEYERMAEKAGLK